MEDSKMAAPSRFPSGVTNAVQGSALGMFGMFDPTRYNLYFNDFNDDALSGWTVTAVSVGVGTSGSVIADADGGIMRLTTAANENDGAWYESPGESWVVRAGKKAWLKCRIAVGNAIESDFIFGFHSTSVTPQLATLRFAFVSDDGSAAVYFNVDDNTTDADSATVATLATDTFVTLEAYYDGKGEISLYADGAKVASMTNVSVPAGGMALGIGYLNGAAGAETTDFDYIFAAVER